MRLAEQKYQTVGKIREHAKQVFANLPKVELGWPFQCRCGETTVVKYRGRFYCAFCARLKRYTSGPLFMGYESLEERYKAKIEGKGEL